MTFYMPGGTMPFLAPTPNYQPQYTNMG